MLTAMIRSFEKAEKLITGKCNLQYKSKHGRQQRAFDALEWLAAMSSHIPDKGEQMVRYYGYYSNVCRGRRQKANQDGVIPYIIEQEDNSKEYRRTWARLIQKIYEVHPLT
jgi:hypothetical protein